MGGLLLLVLLLFQLPVLLHFLVLPLQHLLLFRHLFVHQFLHLLPLQLLFVLLLVHQLLHLLPVLFVQQHLLPLLLQAPSGRTLFTIRCWLPSTGRPVSVSPLPRGSTAGGPWRIALCSLCGTSRGSRSVLPDGG